MTKKIAKMLIELKTLREAAFNASVKAHDAQEAAKRAESIASETSTKIIAALKITSKPWLNKYVILPDGTLATIQDHHIGFTAPNKIEKLK